MKKKIKTDERTNSEVKKLIAELYEIQSIFNDNKKKYESRREYIQKEIRNFMFINGIDSLKYTSKEGIFEQNPTKLKVTNVKRKQVIFDVEALKNRLDKDILSLIIKKTYTIIDWDGLKKYLKSCGVNPKTFLSFINIESVVDDNAVDDLLNSKELSLSDLKGCYEVKENVGYIKITELDGKDE